jgi:hypothetical protein
MLKLDWRQNFGGIRSHRKLETTLPRIGFLLLFHQWFSSSSNHKRVFPDFALENLNRKLSWLLGSGVDEI